MKNQNDKRKQAKGKKLVLKKKVKSIIQRIFMMAILFLISMILVKKDDDFKSFISENVYEKSFQFTRVRKLYQQYFGDILSIEDLMPEVQPVFNETISYIERNTYEDGVKLTVREKYLVPVIESGIVVFIGEKEGYGQTVVIEQVDGVSVWYANVSFNNLKLYDYIQRGTLLGEVNGNELFLTFRRNGVKQDYKEFI